MGERTYLGTEIARKEWEKKKKNKTRAKTIGKNNRGRRAGDVKPSARKSTC